MPGWLSQLSLGLQLRSWSHGLWVGAPHWALCWQLRAWSLLQILCLCLSLPLPCSCSVSLSLWKTNKHWKKLEILEYFDSSDIGNFLYFIDSSTGSDFHYLTWNHPTDFYLARTFWLKFLLFSHWYHISLQDHCRWSVILFISLFMFYLSTIFHTNVCLICGIFLYKSLISAHMNYMR